jgi:hypothetical protein
VRNGVSEFVTFVMRQFVPIEFPAFIWTIFLPHASTSDIKILNKAALSCMGSHAVVWRSLAGISVLHFHYGAAMASGVTRVIHRCEEAQESGYLGK